MLLAWEKNKIYMKKVMTLINQRKKTYIYYFYYFQQKFDVILQLGL